MFDDPRARGGLMTDEERFREIIRRDWLYYARHRILHAPAEFEVVGWHAENVTFACGRKASSANVPGIFSRLKLTRCAQCCDRLGYPRGVGSPKNDDQCRELLGLDKEDS